MIKEEISAVHGASDERRKVLSRRLKEEKRETRRQKELKDNLNGDLDLVKRISAEEKQRFASLP